MVMRRLAFPMLLAVAGLALWMLLAGAESLFGLDLGGVGFAVLVLSAWGALHVVSKQSPTDTELQVSPAEWKAWVGTAFTAMTIPDGGASLYRVGLNPFGVRIVATRQGSLCSSAGMTRFRVRTFSFGFSRL